MAGGSRMGTPDSSYRGGPSLEGEIGLGAGDVCLQHSSGTEEDKAGHCCLSRVPFDIPGESADLALACKVHQGDINLLAVELCADASCQKLTEHAFNAFLPCF